MIFNVTEYEALVGQKPQKRDFYQYWVYSKGKTLLDGASLKEYIDFRTNNVVDFDSFIVEKELNESRYKELLNRWQTKNDMFIGKYKQKVFERLSYSDMSAVNELIWKKAWDKSHSEGYRAVEDEFEDLADFVRNIFDQLGIPTTNG